MKFLSLFFVLMFLSACKTSNTTHRNDMNLDISKRILGTYFSEIKGTDTFKNYSIIQIYPLTSTSKKTLRFYFEQSELNSTQAPFKQIVFEFEPMDISTFRVKQYTLLDPHKYVVAIGGDEVLKKINESKLYYRNGCDLSFTYQEGKLFGDNLSFDCSSKINYATYAKSKYEFVNDSLIIWDRGYDEYGKQVWGDDTPNIYLKKER